MTRQTIVRLATSAYALYLALSLTLGHAAGPDCSRGIPPTRDCPGAISSPPGLPSHGGTVTVHPGISLPCIVLLPGGAKLCAGGETAAPYGPPGAAPPGRAIFRVSGNSLATPGVNIVVSRSGSNAPNGPELLPQLAADAVVLLPPGAVLLRFDAATGRYVLVPNGHIRQAGDTLYKVLRRGAAPTIAPVTPLPATLPATGSSPFGALFAVEGLLIVAGLGVALGVFRFDAARSAYRRRILRRVGLAVSLAGLALAVATGAAFAALSGQQPSGFGTLAQAQGPAPRGASAPGPPTRLVIPRLGIDTRVIPLRVVDGAWQTPSYAAGYLAGAGMDDASNEVITGHDDRDGAVFRRLGELRAGDTVQVFTGSHRSRYTVTALHTVSANRVDVLRPTRQTILTLITCTPYLVDTQRLVARATLLTQGS